MKKYNEINDNEIRVISSDMQSKAPTSVKWYKKTNTVWFIIIICVIIIGGFLYGFLKSDRHNTIENPLTIVKSTESDTVRPSTTINSIIKKKSYVEITDTTINNTPFSIFTPRFAVARLQIGTEVLQDTAAAFVIQAADIRKDNGEIAGTYVSEGNLICKGQSKSGFCAIINGSPIIGVSDATPYLEQAIETNGYFFRQYPLVVGGQIVENKPKGKSIRRALAEWNNKIVVVMSLNRLTFHDFAQALVDMQVSNAIYLVGSSSSFGFAVDSAGNRIEFGQRMANAPKNTNYIVWE